MLQIEEIIENKVQTIAAVNQIVGSQDQHILTDIGLLSAANVQYLVAQGVLIVDGDTVGIRGGTGGSRLSRWSAFEFVLNDLKQSEGISRRDSIITRMREKNINIRTAGEQIFADIVQKSKNKRKPEIDFDW